LFTRQVKGTGGTQMAAANAAQQSAAKAVNGEVDQHPCPECGLVQADMAAVAQWPTFKWSILFGVLGVAVACVLGLSELTSIAISAYLASGVVVFASLGLLAGVLKNPNKDMEANAQASRLRLQGGEISKVPGEVGASAAFAISFGSASVSTPGPTPGGPTLGGLIGLAIAAMAILPAIAPEAIRLVSGWPLNPEFYPQVVGPGDSPHVYFKQRISSVNAMWRGSVTSTVTSADDPQLIGRILQGDTKKSNWGLTISSENSGNSTRPFWAKITIPQDPLYAGQTIRLNINANAVFPAVMGRDQFMEQRQDFARSAQLHLSGENAGLFYKTSWYAGQAIAALLLIIAGVQLYLMNRKLRKSALPTEICSVGE